MSVGPVIFCIMEEATKEEEQMQQTEHLSKSSQRTRRKNPGAGPGGYHLSPTTDEQVRRKAAALGVAPELVVEVAVAQWLRQQ